MTQASFSASMPSGSWMKPSESDRVIALPPRRLMFSTVYWATLPEPETRQLLPRMLSPRVLSISSAK